MRNLVDWTFWIVPVLATAVTVAYVVVMLCGEFLMESLPVFE